LGSEILGRISKNLVALEPTPGGLRFASVAIIIDDRKDPRILLIKRAERIGDPWSGQIAFPGGKMQPEDGTARRTAERETLEEVGIDLGKTAEFQGYAAVATTHTGTMDVVPTVFVLKEDVEAKPNEEVASYRWVGLEELLAPEAQSLRRISYGGKTTEMPAYVVGEYVVWGLTHRILSSVLAQRE
jgi:8-oxo-dGTP pyrophosphatase MutT (NUDIX family)